MQSRLPKLADYVAYYLAAAHSETGDYQDAAREGAAVDSVGLPSPVWAPAIVLRARALAQTGAAQDGIQILKDHYLKLPQPDGDLALAAAYEAAHDLPHAVEYYQRVYYLYPAASRNADAAAALAALRNSMGASYPRPASGPMIERGNKLLAAREYGRARAEFEALALQLSGAARDLARVDMGAAEYLYGDIPAAYKHLRALEVSDHEAEAARLYYLAECSRRLNDDEEMMQAVRKLDQHHAASPWRFKALVTAANRFQVQNQPAKYLPLYKAAYEGFPDDPRDAACHWRVAWEAYLHRKREARQLLREHLERHPAHPTASAALYFLGRLAEADNDNPAARAYYIKVTALFQNHYYGVLAHERLAQPAMRAAGASPDTAAFLARIAFSPQPRAVPSHPDAETTLRTTRATLLQSAGLADLAEAELRFGMHHGSQPYLLAMALARTASKPHQRLRYMKGAVPDYLALSLEDAPSAFWQMLFPLPYQKDLLRNARQQKLDPYMLAALIRQESEFDPQALSAAHAYGLTQVEPATGRALARRAGVRHFTNRVLFQPSTNIRLGAYYLRSLLDQWGGRWEPTLASYNAGKARVNDWLAWNNYQEPAEFVETIPFTETREYVEAVMRNAAIYRQLYGPAKAGSEHRPGRRGPVPEKRD